MKIAINAQSIGFTDGFERSGTSRYSENLLKALSKIDSQNEYTVFVRPEEVQRPLHLGKNFRLVHAQLPTSRPTVRILWEQAVAPFEVWKSSADVYHCLLNAGPWAASADQIVTIHDLGPFEYPETYRWSRRVYQQTMIQRTAQTSAAIITPTESVKKEIAQRFRVDESKIFVTSEGVSKDFYPKPESELEAWKKSRGIRKPFFLYIGNLEPKKNVVLLLKAFHHWKQISGGSTPADLFIIGGKAWMYDEILSMIPELGLEGEVHMPGYVPDEELSSWYGAATAFVYPSSYEGFGLPPLEAMACGCPVIVSHAAALVEVGGGAVVSVDPKREEDFAHLFARFLLEPEFGENLRKRGLERAKGFTWEAAAQRTLSVYETVVARKPE